MAKRQHIKIWVLKCPVCDLSSDSESSCVALGSVASKRSLFGNRGARLLLKMEVFFPTFSWCRISAAHLFSLFGCDVCWEGWGTSLAPGLCYCRGLWRENDFFFYPNLWTYNNGAFMCTNHSCCFQTTGLCSSSSHLPPVTSLDEAPRRPQGFMIGFMLTSLCEVQFQLVFMGKLCLLGLFSGLFSDVLYRILSLLGSVWGPEDPDGPVLVYCFVLHVTKVFLFFPGFCCHLLIACPTFWWHQMSKWPPNDKALIFYQRFSPFDVLSLCYFQK